jgi:hypothetical protein
MNKRAAHHLWTKIRPVKAWYFLLLAVVFAAIGAWAMRANYAHMVTLREAVYAADQKGQGVDEALKQLRDFVGHHMNTNLSSGDNTVYPPIQLKYTYDRLITAKGAKNSDYNAHVYTKAQDYCEKKIPNGFHGDVRVQCIQDYVTSHSATPDYISADLYKFDFYSPGWSPDLAGITLVLAIMNFVAFVVLFVARRFIHAAA